MNRNEMMTGLIAIRLYYRGTAKTDTMMSYMNDLVERYENNPNVPVPDYIQNIKEYLAHKMEISLMELEVRLGASLTAEGEMEREMMKLDPMYRVNTYAGNKDTYRSFVKSK